jgi:hypothetical protein
MSALPLTKGRSGRRDLAVMSAPPRIAAPHWFNAKDSTTLDLSHGGPITIVEFSAWWCAGCSLSYPDLLAVQRKYGADKVHLVLVTNLMGRLRADTALTTDDAIAVSDLVAESEEGDYGSIARKR